MNFLKKLYDEDVKEKWAINRDTITEEELETIHKNDRKRKEQVLKLHKQGKITSALDNHYAALIMQHGETTEDFKLANKFAKKAINLGDTTCLWLYAATIDRVLVSQGKPQKYGTQFNINKQSGYELSPVDPNTTDEERRKYGVPPLKDAVKEYKKKYGLM